MTSITTTPYTPPASLSKAAQSHWRALVVTYGITDTAGRLLLEAALTSFDRMQQASAEIKKTGLMVRDRWGGKKPNPMLGVERQAKAEMLKALAALHLDLEPLNPKPGRPPNQN